MPAPGQAGAVQRDAVQRQETATATAADPGAEFARIHYLPMPTLLRELENLRRRRPFSAEDHRVAREKFGPRLVVAMKVVEGRVAADDPEVTALPVDQVDAITRYLRFAAMWAAHPHSAAPAPAANQTSPEVLTEHGLPQEYSNTCAIRVSVMLNQTGQEITPAKTRAAGLSRRPHRSSTTNQYYILAASEMWTYLNRHFQAADAVFPATGRYRNADEFNNAFRDTIEPIVNSRKGIAAFDRIFGYGGTGHIDLFDGQQLSHSSTWYPCQRLRLWYIVVP